MSGVQPQQEVPSPTEVSPSSKEKHAAAPGGEDRILLVVFLVLFAQVVLIILASLVLHRTPEFVGRDPKGFATDFLDFYRAGLFYSNHLSPYLTGRFVWPPFALVIGLLASRLPWTTVRYVWLVPNLAFVLIGLLAYARQIQLERRNKVLLLMIAGVFYPVLFLLERGHVDGLMMACIVLAFCFRNRLWSSVFLGLSIGVKLYSTLLLILLAVRKRFAVLIGAICVAVLIQLPWPKLALSYPQIVARRTSQWVIVENITPAPLFQWALGGVSPSAWKLAFVLFWLATLLWTLLHMDTASAEPADWVQLAPWMFSMPLVVYPYTAILSLPLLAYQAKRLRGTRWGVGGWLLVVGFLLLATEQNAWVNMLLPISSKAMLIYSLNSLGTAVLMLSSCVLAWRQRAES